MSDPKAESWAKPTLNIENKEIETKVKEEMSRFVLTPALIERIRKVYDSEIILGLQKNPTGKSSLQMENTFVPELPDGQEDGDYLALDLGGTHFRVILIKCQPGKPADSLVKYYVVPEELRIGDGIKLFDFLAECIFDFVKNNGLLDRRLPLGFCFSFPMIQHGINVGILVTWTKSFNCPNAVGVDAVMLLQNAIQKRGDLKVDVVAIVNDTTGTLVKGAHLDKRSAIGLILGTGCNMCYLEKVSAIEKWEGDHGDIEEVVIDTETGAFGDNGVLDFIKTDEDWAVNSNSLIVDSFTFEKLFSGKYNGEIVRQIMMTLIKKKLLFGGVLTEEIQVKQSFVSKYVSAIESDLEDLSPIQEILFTFGYKNASNDDIEILRYVCSLTTVRGALIVSICLAYLLNRMKKPFATIAIDGSLYKKHPKYHGLMTKFIQDMAPEREFKLILAEDGSGKGAGLVAAIADKLRKQGRVVV